MVNKADREGADHTVMALQMMQGLAPTPAGHHSAGKSATHHAEPGPQADGSWLPPITKTVAVRGDGVAALRNWIEAHAIYLTATGQRERRDVSHAMTTLSHILRDDLMAALLAQLPAGQMSEVAVAVARRDVDPYSAAGQLLAAFLKALRSD